MIFFPAVLQSETPDLQVNNMNYLIQFDKNSQIEYNEVFTDRESSKTKSFFWRFDMYVILESNDYEKLTYLFYENGLEITPGSERADNVVKCWECKDPLNNMLIGGSAIEMRSGCMTIADLAINQEYRREKIGTQLMATMEEEIKKMGWKEAWLVAKEPGFYLKLGWETVAREQAPDISNCFSCARFGKDCNPLVMRKTL